MKWYFIRITSDSTSKHSLSQLFPEPWLISKEYSKRMKLHYHILTQSPLSKDDLKNLIYDHLPEDTPRGIHTLKVDLVGETVADFETAATYTVKDGDFIYSEYFADKIETYVANSYQKQMPYPKALKKLISETTDNEFFKIDWRKLKVNIAILRSKYGLEIYKSKIEAQVLSIQISMNENIAEELFS